VSMKKFGIKRYVSCFERFFLKKDLF